MDCFKCVLGKSSYNSGKGKSRVYHIKCGYSLMKGKASHPMEDYHVAKFVKIDEHELGMFAIYDGHMGDSVPAYLQKHLFANILKEEEFWTDPMRSISKAYEKTDQAILSNSSNLGRGGSTAVTAIIINARRLWVANIGDSRAVLSRRGEAMQMTVDHEPNTERGSIENKEVLSQKYQNGLDVNYREAECFKIDPENKKVLYRSTQEANLGKKEEFEVDYDYLVVAMGAQSNTFNTPGVVENTHFLKEVEDAQRIRRSVIDYFERASLPSVSDKERERILHFVVVGGGPT